MRSRPWLSTTRRPAELVELARDQRNLLRRDAVDDNLAMGVADDVFGDSTERALIRPVLVADPHHDQVRVFLPRDLDDSVGGLGGGGGLAVGGGGGGGGGGWVARG